MNRRLLAFGFGIFLTLSLGFLSAARPFVGYRGVLIPPQANLQKMKDGTAHQPYVRRRLVPVLLRSMDHVVAPLTRAKWNSVLSEIDPLKPFLIERAAVVQKADAVDGLLCLVIWLFSFTIFAWTLESEMRHYLADPRFSHPYPSWAPASFTGCACVVVVLLLHNNFIYDPVTLACAAQIVPALRRERLLPLIILTAIFSGNRETAFIVPGFAFFYWVYRQRYLAAFTNTLALVVVYVAISGSIAFYYRHNPGSVAIYNLHANLRAYSHEHLPQMLLLVTTLGVYSCGVHRYWRSLPTELKAVQWFILPWLAMHFVWGWVLEWRVFFEIYPGVLLTSVVLWSSFQRERRSLRLVEFVFLRGRVHRMEGEWRNIELCPDAARLPTD
jgi:hypothetical protein